METNTTNTLNNAILDEVKYYRCSDVDIDFAYQAFSIGFSDYIVKLDLPKEQFIALFFGPEGNKLEHSFVAIHENDAVGVILGGIKNYENIKTMRCGTLAISPSFRGKGISQKLFELHKEEAEKNECKQLFLEVIVGNDRAINFYKKLGYEKVYDLSYFTNKDTSNISFLPDKTECNISKIEFNLFKDTVQQWDYHINWQNDLEFLEKATNFTYYQATKNDVGVGTLAINKHGKISFIMVDKKFRNSKVATNLLKTAILELELNAISTAFPNNSSLEGFFNQLQFNKEKLSQYEMYKTLN
ncbi:GNAT family N-acetyltransferase [Bacillus sp. EAC]|uniref:GNAT family N-acetyltransferase n=1 Tax=Bacillus sp. EAC TaxID=1978338 RepID=UPI000B451EB2|nr:GNAT family N-acetyltransferase [Bacillus sp. EAC]